MAELRQQERLQPSLLDRLTDEEPDRKKETRSQRVLSLKKMRESIKRDVAWLLNSANLASTEDLEAYPEVAHSVLNYGMPDLAGRTVADLDIIQLERLLQQVIVDFEPRILKNTVKIRLVVDEQKMSHNAVIFEIEGQLWAQPTPLKIFLRTELDLEIGDVKVSDYSGSGGS
jgi:type VI secretion system protein ImpF